jgi:hypothetical protein
LSFRADERVVRYEYVAEQRNQHSRSHAVARFENFPHDAPENSAADDGHQNQRTERESLSEDCGWKGSDRGGAVKRLGSTDGKNKNVLTPTGLLLEGLGSDCWTRDYRFEIRNSACRAKVENAIIGFGLLQQLQALPAQLGLNGGKQTESLAKPVEPNVGKSLT